MFHQSIYNKETSQRQYLNIYFSKYNCFMKKIVLIFIFIFLSVCFWINYQKSSSCKVLKIISHQELFIDLNKNFILDEKEPFKIDNIYDISDFNEEISRETRFIADYFSRDFINNLLKNNFVTIKENDLILKGKSYRKLLLDSGFFYDSTIETKENFKNKINNYNTKDYVLTFSGSKKYHKISCPNAKEIKTYKIVKKNSLPKNIKPAKCCHSTITENTKSTTKFDGKFSSGNIKIFFVDLNSVMEPDNTCQTDICKALKNEIDNAKNTIDFAVYGFNNQPKIFKALENAKKRGIKIRWVTNFEDEKDAYYPEIARLKVLLPSYNTNKTISGAKPQGLMHNKFFIFDHKKVFTGSANITTTDLSGFNANYSVLIDSKDIANIYEKEFEQMYKGNFGKNKISFKKEKIILNSGEKLSVHFSPQDSVTINYLLPLIKQAKKYIYIPAFLITDKKIQEALIAASNKGVEIKVINDATNAKSKYTVHKILRRNKIAVKTENYAGKMHMKSMIIDDKFSVIGSMNFTSSGNKRNDENVIIIESSEITKYLKDNFIYLWNKILDKYLYYDPMAESLESIGSCYDGIDNDFDKKTDKEDEGCFIKR